MPFREVIRAKKLGGQFAGHARRHARRVAESATAPFRDRLPPEREFLDLYEYQVAVGERLDQMHVDMIVIDDRHARELQIDRQLREQRDDWVFELRQALLKLKDTTEGSVGPGASRAIFHEDPPRLPNDPVALHQVAQRVYDTLTTPGFVLESGQPGVVVNPMVLAEGFERPLNGLGSTLALIHDSESETRHTQSRKDQQLEELEVYNGKVARFFESLYDLSGHERLARRLRRSTHLRLVEGDPGSGPAPAGDVGSAESDAEGNPAETPIQEIGEEATP